MRPEGNGRGVERRLSHRIHSEQSAYDDRQHITSAQHGLVAFVARS